MKKNVDKYLEPLDFTETSNWNNAEGYSRSIILKFISDCVRYELMSAEGAEDLETVIFYLNNEDDLRRIRVKSLKWFNRILITLLTKSLFALKSKDKASCKKDIDILRKLLPLHKHVSTDSKDYEHNTISINEEKFEILLNYLSEIFMRSLDKLNNADLIYSHVEEFDPRKYKEEIKERLKTQG